MPKRVQTVLKDKVAHTIYWPLSFSVLEKLCFSLIDCVSKKTQNKTKKTTQCTNAYLRRERETHKTKIKPSFRIPLSNMLLCNMTSLNLPFTMCCFLLIRAFFCNHIAHLTAWSSRKNCNILWCVNDERDYGLILPLRDVQVNHLDVSLVFTRFLWKPAKSSN